MRYVCRLKFTKKLMNQLKNKCCLPICLLMLILVVRCNKLNLASLS